MAQVTPAARLALPHSWPPHPSSASAAVRILRNAGLFSHASIQMPLPVRCSGIAAFVYFVFKFKKLFLINLYGFTGS